MTVSASVGAPAVSSRRNPIVATPVPVPNSDEVTGEAEYTKATLMEAMPASALLRSGSAELPMLEAEDLGVELRQRSNSVQVCFAWRLPQRQGWRQKLV